ncbi:uncharacterized protein LOC126834925 [Adelges cooleyi]|uniref:uncharacterized protein LOC126834925 n=1 Tax=Adelges cooleyi TaxID=133065 RepID=UPI002180238C|nr:uncharacterized protein LOC126834925 [Adelges cooleyi]
MNLMGVKQYISIALLYFTMTADMYEIIVEQFKICDKNSTRKLIDAKYNYSAATGVGRGYYEIVMPFQDEDNMMLTMDVFKDTNGTWVRDPDLSSQRMNFCLLLASDMLLCPLFRKMFMRIDEQCPISKTRFAISGSKFATKYRPLLPFGCWKIVSTQQHDDHIENLCMIFHSGTSFSLNHPTCSLPLDNSH